MTRQSGRDRIQGIFTPNMVPLDDRGEINEAELRRYIEWLIQQGVHGLFPNGSTGEFTRFTPEERKRTIKIIAEQTAGRVQILAGAAEANLSETLRACEYYHDLGVRSVAIVSPFYFKLSPDAVYAYFCEIGANTPIDVTLYNIPAFASPIDVDTVARLSEKYERIVAIKDSSGDLTHMLRMIEAVRPNRPDFSFLTGWDPMLMSSLLIGCDGGTLGTSGVAPGLTRRIYDLTRAGQLDEARLLTGKMLRLFDAILTGVDFPEGVRVALGLRGFKLGTGRQPLTSKQQEQLRVVSDKLRDVLADID